MRSNQKGQIIFRNRSSADFGIYCKTPITIPSPQLDVTATHINGRNGDLLQTYESFKNIDLVIDVTVFKPKQYPNLYQLKNEIIDWLTGFDYEYLKFSENPNWVFEAIVSTPPSLVPLIEDGDEEELTGQIAFNCKPLMLKTPSIRWQEVKPVVYNSEKMPAIPDWHVVGNGNLKLTVNGLDYQFNHIQKEIFVDGENCQAYSIDAQGSRINCNSDVVWENNDAPVLETGKNVISWTGDNITKVEYKPKFRRLA